MALLAIGRRSFKIRSDSFEPAPVGVGEASDAGAPLRRLAPLLHAIANAGKLIAERRQSRFIFKLHTDEAEGNIWRFSGIAGDIAKDGRKSQSMHSAGRVRVRETPFLLIARVLVGRLEVRLQPRE